MVRTKRERMREDPSYGLIPQNPVVVRVRCFEIRTKPFLFYNSKNIKNDDQSLVFGVSSMFEESWRMSLLGEK
jgi:hypothetical protein